MAHVSEYITINVTKSQAICRSYNAYSINQWRDKFYYGDIKMYLIFSLILNVENSLKSFLMEGRQGSFGNQ